MGKRVEKIQVCVDHDEHEAIKEEAAYEAIPVSSFVRSLALDRVRSGRAARGEEKA